MSTLPGLPPRTASRQPHDRRRQRAPRPLDGAAANLLSEARARLVTIAESAPLIQAAALLHTGTDLLAVCHANGGLAGVVTKTDVGAVPKAIDVVGATSRRLRASKPGGRQHHVGSGPGCVDRALEVCRGSIDAS